MMCCLDLKQLLLVHIYIIVVQVNFRTSVAISMTEGMYAVVRLRGEAFGIYADEVAIGVDCSETIATDVEPGMGTISVTDASMLLVGVV